MPIQDYPHLTLWKELGFNRLPVIDFAKWVAPLQEAARKKFLATSVFHIGLNTESHEIIFEDLRDHVALVTYGKLQDKAHDIRLAEGNLLIEARKALKYQRNNKLVKDLDISLPPGGGIKLSNNDLWALKQCYHEIQACIKEVRRANDIPLKGTPDFDWNTARGFDLDAPFPSPWLDRLFLSDELPFLVCYTVVNDDGEEILYTRVTDCALEIICQRLKTIIYKISNRRLRDLLKKIPA